PHLQRLSDGRGGRSGDASWGPLSRDNGLALDVGGNSGHLPIRPACLLSGLPAGGTAPRTAGRQPARPLAFNRWRAQTRVDAGRAINCSLLENSKSAFADRIWRPWRRTSP